MQTTILEIHTRTCTTDTFDNYQTCLLTVYILSIHLETRQSTR